MRVERTNVGGMKKDLMNDARTIGGIRNQLPASVYLFFLVGGRTI